MNSVSYLVNKSDLRELEVALKQFKIQFYPFRKVSKDTYIITISCSDKIVLLDIQFPKLRVWKT